MKNNLNINVIIRTLKKYGDLFIKLLTKSSPLLTSKSYCQNRKTYAINKF